MSPFSLVINCPRTDTYDVILTELLANTTLADIVNEVNEDGEEVVRKI